MVLCGVDATVVRVTVVWVGGWVVVVMVVKVMSGCKSGDDRSDAKGGEDCIYSNGGCWGGGGDGVELIT